MLVALAESLDLAFFLGERLHDANARDRIGQHVYHLGPGGLSAREAVAEANPYFLRHPGDQWKWQQRDQSELEVDLKQDRGGHDDHERIGAEIEQADGQE